jgi:hypothetical protein
MAGPWMEADANGGCAVPAHQLVRGPQAEQDRLGGVGDRQHHGVADGLDLAAAAGRQFGAHRSAEIGDQRGGILVAVGLGERREAGDVCKHERHGGGGRVAAGHCVAALTAEPRGGIYLALSLPPTRKRK